jgi:membrane-associated phospholipid phosphatase
MTCVPFSPPLAAPLPFVLMSGHTYSAGALSPRRLAGRTELPGAWGPLGVAGLCMLGLAGVWAVAALVPAAHLKDAVALRDFTLLSRPNVDAVGNFLIHMLEPLLFVVWGCLLAAFSLLRRRPRVALATCVVMAMAPATSETLKPLLAHSHAQVSSVYIAPASWPSGHSSAALALVLCAVLAAPASRRPLVAALGAAYALAVGCALLILAWHMPSDVLGGYLVATLWMALAVAGLRAADRRWPTGRAAQAAGAR